jgi:hypothetical protein
MRSLAVVGFIVFVAAVALYVSQRPTIASGEVLGASLVEANPTLLKKLDCDPDVPIGIDGATFSCRAEFKLGAVRRLTFELTRQNTIRQIGNEALPGDETPQINKSDPWQ